MYDPPSDQECSDIAETGTVPGQDTMPVKFFKLQFDISLKNAQVLRATGLAGTGCLECSSFARQLELGAFAEVLNVLSKDGCSFSEAANTRADPDEREFSFELGYRHFF